MVTTVAVRVGIIIIKASWGVVVVVTVEVGYNKQNKQDFLLNKWTRQPR